MRGNIKRKLILAIIVNFSLISSIQNSQFTMQINPREKACIVEALWHESRGESKQGIVAVLNVIKNRVKSKYYPDSYCDVIHQNRQFTYNNLYRYKKPIVKAAENDKMLFVDDLAENILLGKFTTTLPDNVLWYHTIKIKPSWSKKMRVYKTIGNHVFYSKG